MEILCTSLSQNSVDYPNRKSRAFSKAFLRCLLENVDIMIRWKLALSRLRLIIRFVLLDYI